MFSFLRFSFLLPLLLFIGNQLRRWIRCCRTSSRCSRIDVQQPNVLVENKESTKKSLSCESVSESACSAEASNTDPLTLLLEKEETVTLTRTRVSELECGIWMAPSTLLRAGLGMYAGRSFAKDEHLQETGDLVVPIIDLSYHNNQKNFEFLWWEYTWNAVTFQMDHHGVDFTNVASMGFGAAANCHFPLQNIAEWYPSWNDSGFHRSVDPGAGAISPYGNRTTIAIQDITAGDELFVSYGDEWFDAREHLDLTIPRTGDFDKATRLVKAYMHLNQILHVDIDPSPAKKSITKVPATGKQQLPTTISRQVWDLFVRGNPWNDSSRVLAVFNYSNGDEMNVLFSNHSDIADLKRKTYHRRSTSWLQEHGVCGDHIRVGSSTLPQAGQGAFARRNLPQNTIVATLPLIHIPDRSLLYMDYDRFDNNLTATTSGRLSTDSFPSISPSSSSSSSSLSSSVSNHQRGGRGRGYQVLLNYCFGHALSTLLLCPYGPHTSYINHNQTKANVQLVWSDPERSNHQPAYLKLPLTHLEDTATAKLSLDIIATRSITQGEEILLDYGSAWEAAWQDHVRNWSPVDGASTFKSSFQLNQITSTSSLPLLTEFERIEFNPNPNVELRCNQAYLKPVWKEYYPDRMDEYNEISSHGKFIECDILHSRVDRFGHYLYTAVLWADKLQSSTSIVEDTDKLEVIGKLVDVPRQAFSYFDLPYTADLFLTNAFRHDMRIPDELFPEIWQTLK